MASVEYVLGTSREELERIAVRTRIERPVQANFTEIKTLREVRRIVPICTSLQRALTPHSA